MSDENFNNTDGQNSAPQVSKISLDELNEIKKTIAPIHSENELEVLRNNPDIDSNTVYSEHKPAQTNSEDIDISDLKVETPRIEKNEDGDVVAINEEKPTTSIAPQILETEETSKIDVSEQISENHEEVTQNAQKSEPQANVEEKVSNINKSDNLSLFESIIQELNNIKVIPKTQKPDVNYSRTQGAENITSEHEQLTTSVSQVSENIDSDIPQVEENERPVETEENAQSDAQEIVDEINDLQAEMIDETAKLEEQVNNEQSLQHEEYNDEMEHGLYGKSDDEIVDTSKIESDNTEAIKAEEEAPKTAKVDLSEIKALQAEMKKEKEEGKSERKSIKEIMDEINHKGQNEEEVVEPGEYDKSLDFEKVTDIKKFKLPVRKLPIILSLVFILLAGVGFLLVNNFLQNKANQVYLVKTELNIQEITGGYIGETVDLSGIYFIQTFSDGSKKNIYNIKNYISGTTDTIDKETLLIKGASEQSGVRFTIGEKILALTTKTYAKVPVDFVEVKFAVDAVSAGDEIRFDQIFIKVDMGESGVKLLSINEIKDNLTIIYYGNVLSKSTNGFVCGSFLEAGNNQFKLRYKEGNSSPIEYLTDDSDSVLEDDIIVE